MEVSYSALKNKEVVNVSDGKKLGHIIDILFDSVSGEVKGVVVPGDKRLFRKSDDVFIPLARVKKIGDDVVLVFLQCARESEYGLRNNLNKNNRNELRYENSMNYYQEGSSADNKMSFVRYKRINKKKYK